MNVFISGASGLIGGNCLSHFKKEKWNAVGSHLSYPTPHTVFFNSLEADNSKNFNIIDFQPSAIIHCGALTHVDYCETNEAESFEKTVQSTINLAQIAAQLNATFVLLSTDYIFDGKEGPYAENATPNPLNLYGRHKLLAEQKVQEICPNNHLIIRVTNVYGDELRDKNFIARIIKQVNERQEINLKLPIDQYATPTNALDIAKAIFLLLKNKKQGIYHISSTEYLNRVNLAEKVLTLLDYPNYTITPIATKELQQKAIRPLDGGFICKRFNQEFPKFLFSTVQDYVQKSS